MYVVFCTPGTFDMKSMHILGLSDKPLTSTPIGKFGTGLKYAIAVILRNGGKITLVCNGDKYHFFTRRSSFRDTEFDQVWYRRQNFRMKWNNEYELPFTLNYGKEWEMWMAFREIYANTLDENGEMYTVDSIDESQLGTETGYTYIIVRNQEFLLAAKQRDTIFLDPSRNLLLDCPNGNISEGKNSRLFYRDMRAYELPEKMSSIFTWNIIVELELTEDRTIKNIYEYKSYCTTIIESCGDEKLITQILHAPEESFEGSLDFKYAYGASKAFKNVLEKNRDNSTFSRSARSFYYTSIAPPPVPKVSDEIWTQYIDASNECITSDKERSSLTSTLRKLWNRP